MFERGAPVSIKRPGNVETSWLVEKAAGERKPGLCSESGAGARNEPFEVARVVGCLQIAGGLADIDGMPERSSG
jgi:hypothetical protein